MLTPMNGEENVENAISLLLIDDKRQGQMPNRRSDYLK